MIKHFVQAQYGIKTYFLFTGKWDGWSGYADGGLSDMDPCWGAHIQQNIPVEFQDLGDLPRSTHPLDPPISSQRLKTGLHQLEIQFNPSNKVSE